MENNVIDFVANKKYTDFSDAIKQELKMKLSNREEIKSYTSEFDRIQNMKNLFAQISTTSPSGSSEE